MGFQNQLRSPRASPGGQPGNLLGSSSMLWAFRCVRVAPPRGKTTDLATSDMRQRDGLDANPCPLLSSLACHAQCMAMPSAVRIREQQGTRTVGWSHGSVPQASLPHPDSTLLSDKECLTCGLRTHPSVKTSFQPLLLSRPLTLTQNPRESLIWDFYPPSPRTPGFVSPPGCYVLSTTDAEFIMH